MFAFGDVGISLLADARRLKSASMNFGVWNSLQDRLVGL